MDGNIVTLDLPEPLPALRRGQESTAFALTRSGREPASGEPGAPKRREATRRERETPGSLWQVEPNRGASRILIDTPELEHDATH